MSLTGTALPLKSAKILEVQTKYNEELGRDIEWTLMSIRLDEVLPNPKNNRFAPDADMAEEEHEQAIIEENPELWENLRKSMEINPQFEQLIGYINKGDIKVNLIGGHRRFFAAKKNGELTLLIWVATDLSPEEIEHIRDWPEVNATKVPHSLYFRNKAIHDDLAGRNELDRERRISVWKQKGYTRQQILKAERTFARMKSFCASEGIKTSERSNQVKAFETYDQIVETKLKPLQDLGEIQKIASADQVAKAFLRHRIAHDDLKVAVEGIIDLPSTDPVFQTIAKDPTYLDDVVNLRRLTNMARAQRDNVSIVDDVREFCGRMFSKLVDRGDQAEIEQCLEEFKDSVTRLEALLASIRHGGAQ